MSDGYTFERMSTDDDAIERCTSLLKRAFPFVPFTAAWLRWQYRDNPAGPIVAWNAVGTDGALAAHYALQPYPAVLEGEARKGTLSLNTATDPAHQGKGLFTKLAQRAFETARAEGYEFVVGVANANSTPGFVRRLGFALVTPLHARLGFGLRVSERSPAQFERTWDASAVFWRTKKPGAHYRAIGETLYAKASQPMVKVVLATGPSFRSSVCDHLGSRPIDLWIGLEPGGGPRLGFDIPARLRPSPLNLIFLDLSDRGRTLDPANVRFRAADFDAY